VQLFPGNNPFHIIQLILCFHRSQIINIEIFYFVTDLLKFNQLEIPTKLILKN